MELTEQISILERVLQEHIRKWDRFFNGGEKIAPQVERDRIARRIRFLSEQTVNRRAEQFRIEQLQHRFTTYSTNWERMLRAREEGRAPSGHTNPALRAPEAANASAAAAVQKEGENTLYDRYCKAKSERGLEVNVNRETFDEQIDSQRQKIEGRLGQKVRFDVQVEDGKVRVVARKQKKK